MTAGENCPFHLGLGSPVGPHRIDCDYRWHSRKGDCNLAGLLRLEDLAAFVMSAFGTDAVRHLLFVAVGTFRQRIGSEKVVSAAASGTSLGVPPFWIRHGCDSLVSRPALPQRVDRSRMSNRPPLPQWVLLFQFVLDVGQCRPARIGRLLFAGARLNIQISSASGTEATAALAAHDPQRQC